MGRILLVEDDPHGIELTMTAREECHLVNEVVVAHDEGQEALDDLYRRGNFWGFVNAVKGLGGFGALVNEPPPGSVKRR